MVPTTQSRYLASKLLWVSNCTWRFVLRTMPLPRGAPLLSSSTSAMDVFFVRAMLSRKAARLFWYSLEN